MPKTAVNEDNRPMAGKRKIRAPRKIRPVEAETETAGVKRPTHEHLGLRIASADPAHVEPSLGWRQDIGHLHLSCGLAPFSTLRH